MQSTVTLELYEYNDLYLKAIQHDDLKAENEKLKEELAIAHKQLEELQQPEEKAPTCEVGMGNMKIAEPTEESKEKFRAKYPDGVTLIDKDDPTKSIRLCDKNIYSIKDNGNVRHVGTIEKQSNGDINEKVCLAGLEISSLLKEMYHPHMSVLITPNGVTMLEDHLFVPNK